MPTGRRQMPNRTTCWRAPSAMPANLPPPPQRWKKIAEGTYGVCENLRRGDRLPAPAGLPAARRCLACQQKSETRATSSRAEKLPIPVTAAARHNGAFPASALRPSVEQLIAAPRSCRRRRRDIRDLVSTYLGSQGIAVFEASSEAGLRLQIAEHSPEVILLDVNLGAEDGFAIARRLRADWHGGLLMVTGRGDMIDRVVGLEIGPTTT